MDVVTIDIETFYDQDYSLSKLTTEEYIRDDRFEVIGVSVKVNDEPADWYSGSDVGKFLNGIDYTDKAICCHHAAFDGAILSWVYSIKPKLWLCTMSMARPKYKATTGVSLAALGTTLHIGTKGTEVVAAKGMRKKDFTSAQLNRYGNYCVNDNDICRGIYKILVKNLPVSELLVIDATIRMYTEPHIELDRSLLVKHLQEVKSQKETLLTALSTTGVSRDSLKNVLSSNKKFATLLERMGVIPPLKISPRTGKQTYAFARTDPGFQALQEHENPLIQHLVAARMGVKSTLEETRTQRLIEVSERGPLPIMLSYYSAHTGRYGGGDKMNLQNLPARKGNVIRQALCAPEGYVLVVCDSSQIEARVLAWLAGQVDLLEAFREGRDVYSEFASSVFDRLITKANVLERFVGKTCILGLGYGMGGEKLMITLAQGQGDLKYLADEREAHDIVRLYRREKMMIPRLWRQGDSALQNMASGRSGQLGSTDAVTYGPKGIELPNGMTMQYSQLEGTADGFRYLNNPAAHRSMTVAKVTGDAGNVKWTSIYGGKVIENITQALARIIVVEQMLKIGQYYPVLFQVHDENIILAKESEADRAAALVSRVMATPPSWAPNLPIACEVGIGPNYGDAK